MKILILGQGRHGKDTLAELLRDRAGIKFESSSRAALEVIFPVLKVVLGYSDPEQAYEERVNNRGLWKELISLYNAADPAALARLILEENDMYVGMRSATEFHASVTMFDLIIYVDASRRVAYRDPSMGIPYIPHMMERVDNNGNLEDLQRQADRLIAKYDLAKAIIR